MVAEQQRVFLAVEDDRRLGRLLATGLCPPGWRPIVVDSAAAALGQLGAGGCNPDVVLVDLGLPDMDGAVLIGKMLELRPTLPVVVLTGFADERRIMGAIRSGARGYLLKEDLNCGLATTLAEASAGGAPMSRLVARVVLDQVRRQDPHPPSPEPGKLTERERQVVEQFARGLSYVQAAGVLDISPNTVRTHVRTIYDKLSVSTKTEAVLAAMRLGLIA